MATIKSYNKRLESMRSERSSFFPVWQELSDYHLSHRGRFLVSDRNKGHKRNTRQINHASREGARTLASGMMAGITSPSRPWFTLSTGETDLDEIAGVKEWLHRTQQVMYRVFAASNTYNALHTTYAEMSVFGTASLGVFQDFDNVIWCKPYTVGSYMLAADGKNKIDSFYREYERTVGQLVKEFGKESCSQSVQQQWDKGNTEAWVPIVHATEPNDDRDMASPRARDKRFRSVYYEKSAGGRNDNQYLRESGFDEFPFLTPRWDVTGEDIYATDCPGMVALGDTKALQLGEKRYYQAVDVVVSPPLQAPASMRNTLSSGTLRPNDVVYSDDIGNGMRSIYDFRPDLNAIREGNSRVEERISSAFYEDLFFMIANSQRQQTATEVLERNGEKLLMLGPMLERVHNELLDPLIDRTFNILQRNGVLPPPPPDLAERELQVEYISVLAQAQRLAATDSLERLTGFAGQLASVWPEARHKIDPLQAIDAYSSAVGTDPKVVRSDDLVEAIVAGEQEAAARAQAMEQGQALADTAKTMADTSTQGGNALGDIIESTGAEI